MTDTTSPSRQRLYVLLHEDGLLYGVYTTVALAAASGARSAVANALHIVPVTVSGEIAPGRLVYVVTYVRAGGGMAWGVFTEYEAARSLAAAIAQAYPLRQELLPVIAAVVDEPFRPPTRS